MGGFLRPGQGGRILEEIFVDKKTRGPFWGGIAIGLVLGLVLYFSGLFT